MNNIEELTRIFEKFPGIGPRQAKRFVYYLLSRGAGDLSRLATLITEVKKSVKKCDKCYRLYQDSGLKNGLVCSICSDPNRNHNQLMVVCRESDLEAINKAGAYTGLYFVLGGIVPILHDDPENLVRTKELIKRLETDAGISEIIISTNANTEGENTADFVRAKIREFLDSKTGGGGETGRVIDISTLGRGLSTGSELEYADSETIRYALLHKMK